MSPFWTLRRAIASLVRIIPDDEPTLVILNESIFQPLLYNIDYIACAWPKSDSLRRGLSQRLIRGLLEVHDLEF